MHFQRFVLLLVAVSLWTGTLLAQPSTPSLIPRTVNLPVINLTVTETAQINVVNLAASVMPVTTSGKLPSGGVTASCTGSITFYGPTGLVVGSSTPFTIGSGQIFSANLEYNAISPNNATTASGGRTPIRGEVTIIETVGSGTPCTLASNLETFDFTTGVTNVHVDGSLVEFFGVQLLPLGR
jgi:hypothetical protein